ncbi:hypothetical protein K439DRAFT_916217 [Ramaria rubella]|nr:hypothetical protein K439DRAFT_916217 [Ramaria rubella]
MKHHKEYNPAWAACRNTILLNISTSSSPYCSANLNRHRPNTAKEYSSQPLESDYVYYSVCTCHETVTTSFLLHALFFSSRVPASLLYFSNCIRPHQNSHRLHRVPGHACSAHTIRYHLVYAAHLWVHITMAIPDMYINELGKGLLVIKNTK